MFGLILRVSIYEFDRNSDSKMRILKSQLLSMLKEKGYSDLFVEFCVGILFTKDVDSIKTFSELRFMIEEVILSSKSSFDSFSNSKNDNTFKRGLKHLKGTSLNLGISFDIVKTLIPLNQISLSSKEINPEKEGEDSKAQSKRLLKYKSSDETFNYQSYIMKTNDQVPELSEIMAKRKQNDLMQNSNDNDTLKSLASYLRKGEFDSMDKKISPVKSTFRRANNNDTLNLTLDNRSNEYLLDRPHSPDRHRFKEINQDSDIEVSGLNSKTNSHKKNILKDQPKDTYDRKQNNNSYGQLMNNFNEELQVDVELDSINQKINSLKQRIQQHKKNLFSRNKPVTMAKPLSNIRDFNNNIDDKNSDNSPHSNYKRSRPVSMTRNRENNPEHFLNQDRDPKGIKNLRESMGQHSLSNHRRSSSYTPNTMMIPNKPKFVVPANPPKNEYYDSIHRQRNQSMGRSYSRSSSYKRRIKLESVGTGFFKDLVSKNKQESEYDNYYSN